MSKLNTNEESTYFFIGRLLDQSARYNIQEFSLVGGFYLEVLLDGIAVWGTTSKPFNEVRLEVRDILDTIVAAFVFKTKKPLSYTLDAWVETKEVVAKRNMIGWIIGPLKSRKHYSMSSKNNAPWKKAATLYNMLARGKGNRNHLLALKDFRAAVMDTSEDAFLFAYRSVEDICRAINNCDDIKNKNWTFMHQTLKTSKNYIEPLTEVATKVRHGNIHHTTVIVANSEREKLINIAHEIIGKELKQTFHF